MERDILSVLSIYPRIFLRVFIVYCLLLYDDTFYLVFYYMFMCIELF